MSDLLALAIHSSASDLHLRAGEPPLYRVDGRLIRADGPPIRSNDVFDLIQAFTPEDVIRIVREVGQADFGFAFERQRFRVNVFRAEGEWGAVLRRIPENVPTLQSLLAPPVFYGLARLPRGLVLVTGPTGSGKSTTLAAMIDLINTERSDVHVLTLEDPIEFKFERKQAVITQRELGTDFLTFADGLRAAMREDPDVIMVGEMRDPETMEAALMAAETGHLVLSTVHTIGAKDTVDRVISAFPRGQQDNVRAQLASILRGVISQVLLPHASGRGRVAAFEIMVGTPAVANLIRDHNTHQIPGVLQTQSKEGMCTLDQSLAERCAEGLVTFEAAMERAQDIRELRNRLNALTGGKRVGK
ncbi:MAG TPA: type IV pilus twitching motility protein PilT [Verrucomicrobia bacterium]|nr:type IV pilus twitching motility protein PilT [Verrucomicrobiota bacterium]